MCGKTWKKLKKNSKKIPTTAFIRGFSSLKYRLKPVGFPTNCENFEKKFLGEGGLRGPKPHSCVTAKIFLPIYYLTSKRLEIFTPFFHQWQTPSTRTIPENFVTISPKMGEKLSNNAVWGGGPAVSEPRREIQIFFTNSVKSWPGNVAVEFHVREP